SAKRNELSTSSACDRRPPPRSMSAPAGRNNARKSLNRWRKTPCASHEFRPVQVKVHCRVPVPLVVPLRPSPLPRSLVGTLLSHLVNLSLDHLDPSIKTPPLAEVGHLFSSDSSTADWHPPVCMEIWVVK